jgi:hypothetical protein
VLSSFEIYFPQSAIRNPQSAIRNPQSATRNPQPATPTKKPIPMRSFIFSLLLVALPLFAFAQTDQQQIDLDGARAVHIYAAFSSVEVLTGGQGQVSVEHDLMVDGEDREELRKLSIERSNGILTIRELRPTAETLKREFPHKSGNTITSGRKGGEGTFNGILLDATLKVIVPAGIKVTVETEYGGIRVVNVAGLVSARAKYGAVDVIYEEGTAISAIELYSNYGAVDVTLPAGEPVDLHLVTEYGELLTDLTIDMDTDASKEKEFYQRVVGKIGKGGAKVSCEAPYGNVYLRQGE